MADESWTQALKRLAGKSWPESYPLAQFPNPPLAAGLAGAVGTHVLDGDAADVAHAVFFLGAGAWAYLELAEGVNWFRRGLGGAALVYLALRLGSALG
jgi:hypothetical protein